MRKTALLICMILFSSNLSVMGNPYLFELGIICPDNYTFRMEFAQTIADEFAAIGINVSLDYISMDELIKRCFESDGKLHSQDGFDIAVFGWRLKGDLRADDIYYFFHSENSVRLKGGYSDKIWNCMCWENMSNDDLIDKLQKEYDESELKEYWMQWQELFHEEQPMSPVYHFSFRDQDETYWAFQHISFNLNHPVLKRKLVRQALSHVIPRQKICNRHNKDKENWFPDTLQQAEPYAVPVPPDFWALNEDITPYQYNPEVAKELLFEAGYDVKTKRHESAESLLEQANQAFEIHEFEKALDYAYQAKKIYDEFETKEFLVDVDNVILLYQIAIDAETLLNEGIKLKEGNECEVARQKLLEAQQKFEECQLTQKVSDLELLISEIDEILRKERVIQEADTLFEQGKETFEKENYEAALDYFQQAREKYKSVESEKSLECDRWIKETQAKIEEGFCLGTIFLVALSGIGFVISQQRSR